MDPKTLEALQDLNKEYFGIILGGRTRFCEDRLPLQPWLKDTMKDKLRPVRIPQKVQTAEGEKTVYKPIFDLWFDWSGRRFYSRGLTLDPDQIGDSDDTYNLWKGFDVEPAPGQWPLMKDHIREVLANGDQDHAEYILNWTAWAFQNPGLVARVALVFRGGRGVGKGVFANQLETIFGAHGLVVTQMAQAAGRFNGHLRYCCLLFADEAVVPGTDDFGNLKAMITEPSRPYEAKGVDIVSGENHLKVVLATNEKWAVPAGPDERRFAVFDVSDHRKGDKAYFDALFAQMNNGGREAMLHDLLARDIRDFHPEPAPQTAALRLQKELAMSAYEQWQLGVLEDGRLPGLQPSNKNAPPRTVLTKAGDDRGILQHMEKTSPELKAASDQKKAAYLKEIGCERWHSGDERGWTLPPLADMRAAWDERFGAGREWPEGDCWSDEWAGPTDREPPF